MALSQRGPVTLIFYQYANYGKGKSIHSLGQLKHYGNEVNEKSRKIKGGKQIIITPEGYFFLSRLDQAFHMSL